MRYLPFVEKINQLQASDAFRQISLWEEATHNFLSNDYLGIASDNALLREFFDTRPATDRRLGSQGSRLLGGSYFLAAQFEEEIASAFCRDAALLFNSGYHANVGILSALKNIPSCHIIVDRLCHASIYDGIRLASLPFSRFAHNNYSQLESIIQKLRASGVKSIPIVVESLYSMDGDEADLLTLCALRAKYPEVLLYVDEAHAIGVRGSRGLGCAEECSCIDQIDFLVGTFGKAIGGMGAFLVASHAIVSFMVNYSRSFIFSTMLSPMQLAWDRFVFNQLCRFDDRREHLRQLAERLRGQLAHKGYSSLGSSHIIPISCPGNLACRALASDISRRGFAVKAILAPTIPPGKERIRLSLCSSHTVEEIDALAEIIPPFTVKAYAAPVPSTRESE